MRARRSSEPDAVDCGLVATLSVPPSCTDSTVLASISASMPIPHAKPPPEPPRTCNPPSKPHNITTTTTTAKKTKPHTSHEGNPKINLSPPSSPVRTHRAGNRGSATARPNQPPLAAKPNRQHLRTRVSSSALAALGAPSAALLKTKPIPTRPKTKKTEGKKKRVGN
ncbi:hypothetical protein K505DRAFT_165463 [Melanomma pulvis-pyrius CBS 109.77]|uniref:Uncharacterized protein n=1 Tax=Melanomma pulvis-pyrius CBS 109.77 TaxID=1314802 RepID=A0A6A6WP83_9PLEO|nr:hypothetical protein K505DRAFT_165463 [Melanomma pulvis-pyrius CBS 109.77]